MIILLVWLCAIAFGDDTVYPNDLAISAEYRIPEQVFGAADTVTVYRTVINNEQAPIYNLYLTDNLPSEFELIDYTLTINGAPAHRQFDGPHHSRQIPEYNLYEWVLDRPDSTDTLDVTLDYQDTLVLSYRLRCPVEDEYLLPFHTLCGNTDDTGLFTLADPLHVVVETPVGVDGDHDLLPQNSAICRAYPNPFNATVAIRLEGSMPISGDSLSLAIYDVQGRLIYRAKGSGGNTLLWHPEADIAGGVYFYSLAYGQDIYSGKLTYLK